MQIAISVVQFHARKQLQHCLGDGWVDQEQHDYDGDGQLLPYDGANSAVTEIQHTPMTP